MPIRAHMGRVVTLVLFLVAALALIGAAHGQPAQAATCADYANQAAAQQARDTRDADGDGIYCESLPCPCAKPGDAGGGGDPHPEPPAAPARAGACAPARCRTSPSARRSTPTSAATSSTALRKGWPRTLVLNRSGADARRDRLLAPYPTRPGQDRDEYPPAVGRGKGPGLERGVNPRGWRADVRYVPSHENRSHGSTMGIKLRRFCNGTRFRYVFY